MEVCLAHLIAAINTARDIEAVTEDQFVESAMLTPLLILSSDILTSSARYHSVGTELARFAMGYSTILAPIQSASHQAMQEQTAQLESYITQLLDSDKPDNLVTLSRSLQ